MLPLVFGLVDLDVGVDVDLLLQFGQLVDPPPVLPAQPLDDFPQLRYLLGEGDGAGDLAEFGPFLRGEGMQLISVLFHLLELGAGGGVGLGGAAALGFEQPNDSHFRVFVLTLRVVFHSF